MAYNPSATPNLVKFKIRNAVDPGPFNLGTGILNLDPTRYSRDIRTTLTTYTRGITMNAAGTAFNLNTINITATGLLRGRTVQVRMIKYHSSGTPMGNPYIRNVQINAAGTANITISNQDMNTINVGEMLEILVYEHIEGIGRLSQQFVSPVLP